MYKIRYSAQNIIITILAIGEPRMFGLCFLNVITAIQVEYNMANMRSVERILCVVRFNIRVN